MSEKDSDQNVVLIPSEKEVSQFLPNEVFCFINVCLKLHFQSKQQWRIPHLRYFIVIIGTLSASIGQLWKLWPNNLYILGISCCFAYNFAVVCRVNTTMDVRATYEQWARSLIFPKIQNDLQKSLRFSNHVLSCWSIKYHLFYVPSRKYSYFVRIDRSKRQGLSKEAGIALLRLACFHVFAQVMFGTAVSTIATGLIPIAFDYWPTSTLILKWETNAVARTTIGLSCIMIYGRPFT